MVEGFSMSYFCSTVEPKGENMEGINFDNILGEQEIETLFQDPTEESEKEDEAVEEEPQEGEKKEKKENNTAEVVDPEELFSDDEDEQPESVGREKQEDKEKEDAQADTGDGASPNQNFYSSIANALAVDGIFPNLTDDDVKKATDAESFSDLIEAEVNARLDERQQRVAKALDNGVEPTDIRKYEGTLNYIAHITDAMVSEEGEKGEQLRRNLIYQDFINKGYTPEKAQKFTERTIDAGTDIEDAKEALQSNREYFQRAYDNLLQEAEKEAEAEKAERRKQGEQLRNSMMKDKQLLGDMELTNDVRKKAFENISKPIYKDPETGDYLTALQKYETEHRADFLKNVGLLFTLTDGFKDFSGLIKGKVKKEVRKGLRDLESALNSTRRDGGGNLKMVTNVKEDPDSYIGKRWKLDL